MNPESLIYRHFVGSNPSAACSGYDQCQVDVVFTSKVVIMIKHFKRFVDRETTLTYIRSVTSRAVCVADFVTCLRVMFSG